MRGGPRGQAEVGVRCRETDAEYAGAGQCCAGLSAVQTKTRGASAKPANVEQEPHPACSAVVAPAGFSWEWPACAKTLRPMASNSAAIAMRIARVGRRASVKIGMARNVMTI